jgi:lipid-A-disaccharide synthase
MVIAGEVSGDMHAARVIEEMRTHAPTAQFFGVGGDACAAQGMDVRYHTRDMAVMGLVEVLKRYPFFRKVFHEMVQLADSERPDAVLLIDYPGFNLRFAKQLHARGIKVIYYICPQVWAWHRERIPQMAATIDHLITIFPFEAAHFEGTGLDITYAGHPLIDTAQAALAEPPADLPWGATTKRVALLPGSRRQELDRMLPVMCGAAIQLEATMADISFLLPCPSEREARMVRDYFAGGGARPQQLEIIVGQTRQVLRQADAGLITSGTATIEAALMDCPMLVVYRTSPLTYAIGKRLIKVPHIGMVNIVADALVCPEYVQADATPQRLAAGLLPLLSDTPERQRMLAGLQSARDKLGDPGGYTRAAATILSLLQ